MDKRITHINSNPRDERSLIYINEPENYEINLIKNQHIEELIIIEDRDLKTIDFKRTHLEALKRLILYSNGFEKMPNLTKLRNLEVLNLADNNIQSIEGLENLKVLKELNLAKNMISSVNFRLDKNEFLEIFNLSANPVKYFKQISSLFCVKSLKKLYFSDSSYGQCLIANLYPHYRLRVIQSIPSLLELDGLEIDSSERKQVLNFIRNYVLQFESQYEQMRSNLMQEKEALLKSIHKEGQIFAQLQKYYQRHLVNNRTSIFQSRYKVLCHGVLNFQNKVRDTFENFEQRVRLEEAQFITMKESIGNNTIIKYHEHNKHFEAILRSFLCPISEKSIFKDISVRSVSRFGCSNNDGIFTLNMGENIDCNFYLLKSPIKISNIKEWREIITHDFPFFDHQDIIVTNCLLTCDAVYLNNVQQMVMKPPSQEMRVLILVQHNAENSVAGQEEIEEHVMGNGDSSHCKTFHLPSGRCLYYAIEFNYELKDKYELIRDMTQIKNDMVCIEESEKLISFPLSGVEENLTNLTLRGCNLNQIGNVTRVYKQMVAVDVSYNELTSLNPLLLLFPNLKHFNVSHNLVNQPRAVTETFDALEILDVSWNKISFFLEISKFLSKCMRNLREINLECNPFEDVIKENAQVYHMQNVFTHLEKYNCIDMNTLQTDDIEINDIENHAVIKNVSTDQIYLTTLGLINKLENSMCPQNILKHKNVSNELEGVCVKSSKPVRSVTIFSSTIQWISIKHNYLTSVEFGIKHSNLSELYLSHNQIKMIDFRVVPNLKRLDLSYNFIENLKPFKNAALQNLIYLNISGNYIEQLDDLSQLGALEQLYASWNRLKEDLNNLRKINNIVHLKSIDISGNPLNNIPKIKNYILQSYPLIQYINGEEIKFDNEIQISKFKATNLDLSYLLKTYRRTEITNLTTLTINNASLKNIDLTKDTVPHLLSVNLEWNEIEYLTEMHNLPLLRILRLSHNRIKEFHGDQNENNEKTIYDTLDTLYLDHNGLVSVETLNLSGFQNLKHLFLYSNKIMDLKGLNNSFNIRVLVLDKNEITVIPPMFFMKYRTLSQLYLEHNKLQDLKFARNIGSPLVKIFLSYNKIQDFKTLEHLKSLKRLREITLLGNSISWKAEYYSRILTILEHVQYLDGHRMLEEVLTDE